ncbi:MAG: hypothetical protein KGL39_44075 [Patescibacteria group bacterium]|nr:hypothetical protein [Patescibacteria group bacterium]
MSTKPERLLTKKELAEHFQLSERTIDNYRQRGIIHDFPMPCGYGCEGRRCEHQRPVRFKLSDVEAEMRRAAMVAAA